MQFVDKPFSDNVALMSPEHAYMAGRIKTNDLEELRNFERAFPFRPEVVVEVFKELVAASKKRPEPPTEQEKIGYAFERILPRCYTPANAPEWDAIIHFTIEDMADYTIRVNGVEAKVSPGLEDEPTSTILMDYETYRAVLRFEIIEDSHQISTQQLAEWETDEEMMDAELSDAQLEAVAGGKGCGAEACGGDACGADGCGAAAGGGTICGGAACGADACGGAACGGDACGAAGGVGTACGGAACGAAACAADACGAAACGGAACAAAACGADVGVGVCAGNACGANILGGADVGPCAVNVIPGLPLI